ncbi:hypothetical protein LTR95_002861 [Oleoguttula sp. CCFEE 5521]
MDENISLTEFGHEMRSEMRNLLQTFTGGAVETKCTNKAQVHMAGFIEVARQASLQEERWEIGLEHVQSALEQMANDPTATANTHALPSQPSGTSIAKSNPMQVAACLALRTQILGRPYEPEATLRRQLTSDEANAVVIYHLHTKLDLIVTLTGNEIYTSILGRLQEGSRAELLVESDPSDSDFAALQSLDEKVKVTEGKLAIWDAHTGRIVNRSR